MKKENEQNETFFLPKLTYLLIGGCIGAAIAVLIKPKSDQEMRIQSVDTILNDNVNDKAFSHS